MVQGIILAAGQGKRLFRTPSIYGKPFAYVNGALLLEYPLQGLRTAGINDVVIGVHERDHILAERFGTVHGVRMTISATPGTAGCLHDCLTSATSCGIVLYGDTAYVGSLEPFVNRLRTLEKGNVLLGVKETSNLSQYMAVIPHSDGYETRIKPHSYTQGLAYVGIFGFSDTALRARIKSLRPSARGELELTDLINTYAKQKKIAICRYDGEVIDCNNPDSHYRLTRVLRGEL